MTELFSKLQMYWGFPFVRYAVAVGGMIALCASLLGVSLVMKRFSFIGDGLSHVAFGAMAIAGAIRVADSLLIAMPITVLAAVLILRGSARARIKGDAVIAMISVSALAIGYLLMNLFPTSNNLSGDVCSTLFGSTSILTLRSNEVWLCLGVSVLVLLCYVLFYNRIFAVTFDEDFACATGIRAQLYNLMTAVVVAVVIVLAMNLVGSLLISALIIFPAMAAMRVFSSYRGVLIASAVSGVMCALLGILVSVVADLPVGSTIVVLNILLFALAVLIGHFIKRA